MATSDQKYLDESLYPSAAFTSRGAIIPVILIDENGDPYTPGGGGGTWGTITGTPSAQTDLQNGTIQGTFTTSNTAIVTGDSFKTAFQKAQGQINTLSVAVSSLPLAYWAIGGNAITGASNFGSTSTQDVVFISNNLERARLYSNGRFEHSASFTTSANNQVGFNIFPTITFNAAHTEAFAMSLRPTLVASANSQILNTFRIRPTFTNGAFTGLTNNYLLIESPVGTRVGQWFVPNGGSIQYHFGSGTIPAGRTNWVSISGQLTSTAINTGLAGLDMSGIILSNANATGTGTFLGHFMSISLAGNTTGSMFQYRGSTNYNSTAAQTLALAYGIFSQHSLSSNHTITELYPFGSDVEGSTGTITSLAHYRANQSFTGTTTNTYGFLVDDITTGTQTNVPVGFFNRDSGTYNAFNQDTVIGSSNTTNPVPLARLHLIGKNSSSEILRGTSSGAATRFIADDNGRWAFNNGIVSTATMVVRSVQSVSTESIFEVRNGGNIYFDVLHGGETEFIDPTSPSIKLVVANGNSIRQPNVANFFNLLIGTKNFIRSAISASEAAVTYGGTNSYVGSAWHEFKSPNNGRSTIAYYNSSNELMGESWWSGQVGYHSMWDRSSNSESRSTAHSIGKFAGTGDYTLFNSVGGDLYLTVSGAGRILTGGGKLILAPTTTSYASFNVTSGTAPTTPVDGDLWRTSTSWFVRHNSTTYDLLNPTVNNTFDVVFFLTGAATTNAMFDLAGLSALAGRSWFPINESVTLVGLSLSIHGPFQTNNTTSSFSVGIRQFDLDGSGSSEVISTTGTEITSVSQTVTVNTVGANRYRYATAQSTVSVAVNGSTTPKGLMAVVKTNTLTSNSNVYLKLTFKR